MAENSRIPSRRHLLAGAAATTAVWVTPSVIRLDRVEAASPSAPLPIVTGDAMNAELSPGESLRPNGTEYSSNTTFFVFPEERVTLGAAENTDSGDVLPANQEICAYLIHYSPAAGSTTLSGTVTFPGTILGYDFTDGTLAARDTPWGVAGVNYGVGLRRLELPGNDTVTVTGNTVALTMFANAAFVDQMRVFVIL